MKILCLLFFASCSLPLFAQNQDSLFLFVPKHTLHWEIGGTNRVLSSVHYSRILHSYTSNQHLGYGVGLSISPYIEGIISTSSGVGGRPFVRFFEGTDWTRMQYTFSAYVFYLKRLKQSRTFIEFSAGYAFWQYHESYYEQIGSQNYIYAIHLLKTAGHYLTFGGGIRRQAKKGLFFRTYLFILKRKWF